MPVLLPYLFTSIERILEELKTVQKVKSHGCKKRPDGLFYFVKLIFDIYGRNSH